MNAYNGSKHEAKPKTQRYGKRQHLKTRKMNQKPYNKSLKVCSVCTGKYLPSVFSHRPHSFVARSVGKPQVNTFSYRPRTRLISLRYFKYDLRWVYPWIANYIFVTVVICVWQNCKVVLSAGQRLNSHLIRRCHYVRWVKD